MPISSSPLSPIHQAQPQENTRSEQNDRNVTAAAGPAVRDSWHRTAEPVRFATPRTSMPPTAASKHVAALGCAVGTHAVLWAARIFVPALAIPSIGVQVGATCAAFAFGWFAVEHRFGALGCLVGAAVGASVVVAYGISSVPVSMVVVAGLAIGFGGVFSVSYDPDVVVPRPPAEALDVNLPQPVRRETRAQPERGRLQPRVTTAVATERFYDDGLGDELADLEPFLMRIEAKLDQFDGPYAARFMAKGNRVLREAENIQSTENQRETLGWLSKFESFIDTHEKLPAMTPIEIANFDSVLEESLRGLWGNERVKLMARRCAARQQANTSGTTYAVVTGGSGRGKNRFISLMKKAYPVNQTILLEDMSLEDFTGFSKTYVGSGPGLVASLMMESPASICLLHIDEIDEASREKQRALLSLLAPENEVMDGYFGLPINKQRLFIVGTMKSTNNDAQKIDSDLWNRLKKHISVLNKPTPAGLQAIAEMALREAAEKANLAPIPPQDLSRVAAELALRCSSDEVGRDVSEEACVVVDHAEYLRKISASPTKFTPSLALRALDETWTSREYEVRDRDAKFIFLKGAGKKKRMTCLTLFAILESQPRKLRWHHELQDGRVVTAEMSKDRGMQATITSADGSSSESAISINLSYLSWTPMEPNKFLSAERIAGLQWPAYASSTANLRLNDPSILTDPLGYSAPFDEDRRLCALPLILTDTSVTYSQLEKKGSNLGHTVEDERARDELKNELQRLEDFAGDW